VPEGDTVFRAARLLDRTLAGRVLTHSDFRVPQLATADLSGGLVLGTWSRGKHLLTRIDTDRPWTLHTHLKMEGSWHSYMRGQRWRRPAYSARVVLTTDDRLAVGFSLGIVELLSREQEDAAVGHLGPDLLGPDWDEEEAVRRLREEPDRPLADALLDQTRLAGIGNMYLAEVCFVVGLHPATSVGQVSDLPRLLRRAQQMLDVNKERAQQSTTGDLRQGRRMWVYRRDQQPCLRCGTTVAVAMRGDPGRERATYWCPSCQPGPT
jgi:endonuclease-8